MRSYRQSALSWVWISIARRARPNAPRRPWLREPLRMSDIGDQRPLDVLVLYSGYETNTEATREHLHAFALYSRHRVYYAPATVDATPDVDLNLFDAVIIHHSVRLIYPRHGLTPEYLRAL